MKRSLRNLFLLPLVTFVHGQSISVNFGANEGGGEINTGSAVPAGAIPIAGTFWNNASNASGSRSLMDSSGADTGATAHWTSPNTWRSASPGITETSQNGALTKGYLDDGGTGNRITVTNVPYITYNVYVLRGSDQGGGTENAEMVVRPVIVNGFAYQGNQPQGTVSTATIVGNAPTTSWNWTNDDVLLDGRNFHLAPNVSGLNLVVRGNTGTGRGPIAGLQIENSYTGAIRYWDINGSAAGAGGAAPSGTWDADSTHWNNVDGTGEPSAWSDAASVANFAAGTDATGNYTVNVDGTRTADGIVLQRGSLTLTGGAIELENAGLLRALAEDSVLRVESDISGDISLRMEGAGEVTIAGIAAHTGATMVTSKGLRLADTGELSATSVLSFATDSWAVLEGSATVSGDISLAGSTVSLAGDAEITAGGSIILENFGTTQSLDLSGTSTLVATDSAAGEFFFNRGEVTLADESALTVRGFYNRTSGLTAVLNVEDDAALTVNGFMTLGDNVAASVVVNQTGGTVNSLGNVNNPGGNSMSNRWGHWGDNASVVYNLSGGELNIPNSPLYFSWDSPATLNLSDGGTANILGINMGYGTRASAATINLDADGILNIGAAGIVTGGTANKLINLNGGTLGATADWTGVVPMIALADTTVDTTGGSIALLGGISGEGGLIVTGSGTLAISGTNTYTGRTTVDSGTLRLATSNFASEIVVHDGGSIGGGTVATPGTGAIDDVVLENGSGSQFRIADSGSDFLNVRSLTVNGSHTATITPHGSLEEGQTVMLMIYESLGGTTGFGGIEVVSGSPRLAVTKLPDTGHSIDIRVDTFDSVIWRGDHPTSPSVWSDSVQNWLTSSTNQPTNFRASDVIVFDDGASGGEISLAGTISPFSVTFDNAAVDYTLSGAPLAGNGSLVKRGSGTVLLANANTFTGATRVEAGKLIVGNGETGSLAPASAVEIVGGELQVNPANGGVYANTTTILEGGLLSFTGSGDMTITGPTLAGGGNLLFDRDGTVLLNAPNAASGSVTVNRGTLLVDGNQSANHLANGALVQVNPGAAFELRGVNGLPNWANSVNVNLTDATLRVVSGAGAHATDSHGHIGNLMLDGATVELVYSGSGNAYHNESFQLNGNLAVVGSTPSRIQAGDGADASNSGVALAGTRVFDVADVTGDAAPDLIVNAELESPDAGGGVLTKQGAGTLALNALNSYSGGNELLGGTLAVTTLADGASSSIGTGHLAIKNGATLEYHGTGSETTVRHLWLDNGLAQFDIVQPMASLTFSPADGRINQSIVKRGPGALTLNFPLTGAATVTVQDGTLSLPGTNDHTGDTSVSGGTLVVSGSSLSDDSRLSLSGSGRLQLDANEIVGTLVLAGEPVDAGTYGGTGSGAEYLDDRFSGSGVLTVLAGPSGDSFANWIASHFPGVVDPAIVAPNADPDGDGVPNVVELVTGSSPSESGDANLPTLALVTDPVGIPAGEYLNFRYRRSQRSVDANIGVEAQISNDLLAWETAGNGVFGITITETPDAEIQGQWVDVYIPRSLAADGRLFGRLSVVVP